MPATARSLPARRLPSLLLLTETLLLVGLLQMAVRDHVLHQHGLPPWARVLLVMGLVVGVFGGVFLLVQGYVAWTLKAAVKSLPVPTVVVHLVGLVGLFYLYAWYLGLFSAVLPTLPPPP